MTSYQVPWDSTPAPAPAGDVHTPAQTPKRRGRRPASTTRAILPDTVAPDWLYHHLTISGPAERVAAFALAARGSGIIPWRLDVSTVEEDVFVRAVSQPARTRNLSVEGCRILARQFRDAVAAHQAKAAALVDTSLACAFDLHRLLPVPTRILQRGPTHPDALAWLTTHWGVTDRLRQVVIRPQATTGRRLPRGHAVIGYGFFTFGDIPQAAVDALALAWPDLRFVLAPQSQD